MDTKYHKAANVAQGRAVGVVAGATRAFGRRTQGVWGAGPPTGQPPEASSAVIKP